jgi:IBR domain, a half RING-finger domain
MVLLFSLPKHFTKPAAPQRASSSSSALQEALRLNPFAARPSSSDLIQQAQSFEKERQELNDDLINLSRLFPDVQIEVLREILVKFDGDSRLHICVGQLLKHRTQWVNGRWHAPPRNIDEGVPLESTFRSADYKTAAQQFLSQEFRYLSKSTIEGVLAENNFSYARARPTLNDLSNRTWRATIGNLNIFKKRKEADLAPTQLLEKNMKVEGSLDTGSAELNEELQELFLEPTIRMHRRLQQEEDHKLAETLNEAEARKMEALYDCECCCGETTFEKLSSCSTNAHLICFDCIRRTIHEALFGQGWARSVDPDRSALKCLAPLVDNVCHGCIPQSAVWQAVLASKSGTETWTKFEDRLAENSLLKSQLKLVRCPFCSYAEADPSYQSTETQTPNWRIRPTKSVTTLLVMLILIDILPVLVFLVILFSFLRLSGPFHIFQTSLLNLTMRCRSPRFKCRNPHCSRASCLKCQKAWHDPHTCHEPLLVSLRTTVEAARTAAIKRTCPRCGLSFVKSSGCNKLTCVCGYSICYLCRTALGTPSFIENPRARRPVDDMQGYRHFCEHFRVNPGRSCMECKKCDLYRSEDEDSIAKRAGEAAEREWRIKEGMVGVEGLGEMSGHQRKGWLWTVTSGDWTLQGVVDWFAGQLIEVEF